MTDAVAPATDVVTPAGSGTASPSVSRALVFRLGGRELATLSTPGGGIVEIDAWTRIPTVPPHVLGVTNARGKILSVVDVRAELGLPQPPWRRPLRALVVGGDTLRVAVAIEEALGFGSYRPVQSDADRAEPEALARYRIGDVEVADRRVTLIDLPALVDSLRPGRLDIGT